MLYVCVSGVNETNKALYRKVLLIVICDVTLEDLIDIYLKKLSTSLALVSSSFNHACITFMKSNVHYKILNMIGCYQLRQYYTTFATLFLKS